MGQAPRWTLFRITSLTSTTTLWVVGADFIHNTSDTKCVGFVHSYSQFSSPARSTVCPTIQINSDTNSLELAPSPTSSRAQSHKTSFAAADASCKYWMPRAHAPLSDLSEPGVPTAIPSQNSGRHFMGVPVHHKGFPERPDEGVHRQSSRRIPRTELLPHGTGVCHLPGT